MRGSAPPTDTQAWVEAQNKVTNSHLDQMPDRPILHRRMEQLWDFPRWTAPTRRGERLFFTKNDGLQNQPVLYRQDGLSAEPVVLLDPNTLSEDGTIALSDAPTPVQARAGRHGEVDWLVSSQSKDALGDADVFHAGRLAWAVPRGAGELLGNSTEDVAAKLAGILRAARCEIEFDASAIARVQVKLPRSVRRTVYEVVSGTRVTTTALLQFARGLQQSADRAGLMASGDIGVALREVLPSRKANLEGLRTSERALDLLRFWVGAESPLWGAHG